MKDTVNIVDMVDKYGACALLKMIIDTNIEQLNSPKKGYMPGLEYLNNELLELYKKIQNSIIGDIGQMICNVGMAFAGDNEDDEDDEDEGGEDNGSSGETD